MLAAVRSRLWSRGFRQSAALRAAADDAAKSGAAAKLKLNFCVPYQAIVKNEDVNIVTIPGVEGEFGVLANHVPIVSEMQPGVVTVDYGDEKKSKYFVSGGFAFVHANSVADISAAEAVPVEDLDPTAIQNNLKEAEAAYAAATDPKEKAVAQILVEVNKKLAAAAGASATQ